MPPPLTRYIAQATAASARTAGRFVFVGAQKQLCVAPARRSFAGRKQPVWVAGAQAAALEDTAPRLQQAAADTLATKGEAAQPAEKKKRALHTLAGYDIEGVSIGGQETCIILPQLKVAFDIGRCPQRACYMETLCLSHTHMDHVGGAGFYVSTRSLLGLTPPTLLFPAPMAKPLEHYFSAMRELDGSDLAHTPVPILPGGEHTLPGGRHFVRPFRTVHPVPSQGYCVFSRKAKLKAEYAGLPGSEIKALKDKGVQVSDVLEVPEVAFTGDTTPAFARDPSAADALRAKLLIMECTFVDDAVDKDGAGEYGHSHLDEICEMADMFQNEHILLIHFSARYRQQDIVEALEKRLPASLKGRVTPLLSGHAA